MGSQFSKQFRQAVKVKQPEMGELEKRNIDREGAQRYTKEQIRRF
jgi:hypothetical protein